MACLLRRKTTTSSAPQRLESGLRAFPICGELSGKMLPTPRESPTSADAALCVWLQKCFGLLLKICQKATWLCHRSWGCRCRRRPLCVCVYVYVSVFLSVLSVLVVRWALSRPRLGVESFAGIFAIFRLRLQRNVELSRVEACFLLIFSIMISSDICPARSGFQPARRNPAQDTPSPKTPEPKNPSTHNQTTLTWRGGGGWGGGGRGGAGGGVGCQNAQPCMTYISIFFICCVLLSFNESLNAEHITAKHRRKQKTSGKVPRAKAKTAAEDSESEAK